MAEIVVTLYGRDKNSPNIDSTVESVVVFLMYS